MRPLSAFRRRVAAVAVALPLALGMTVIGGGTPAYAAVVAPPPPMIAATVATVARTAGVALCATGVGCAFSAVGVLATGAFWAYQNQDTIAGWWGSLFGDGDEEAEGYEALSGPPLTVTVAGDWKVTLATRSANYPRIWWRQICSVSGSMVPQTGSWAAALTAPGTMIFDGGQYAANNCTSVGGRVVSVELRGHSSSGGTWDNSPVMWRYQDAFDQLAHRAIVKCRNDAGATVTITGDVSYSDVGAQHSATVPGCPEGYRATEVTFQQVPAIGPHLQGDWATAATWKVNESDLASRFPACATVASRCTLEVRYLDEPCVPGVTTPDCGKWYVRQQNRPQDWKCYWGPYQMPMSECKPLRYWYLDDPALDPNGYPSADPNGANNTDGEQQPNPFPTPTPTPTATIPPYRGPRAPEDGDDTSAGPEPTEVPQTVGDCGLGWSALLDGTIVFKAVGCALAWAFVPNSGTLAESGTAMRDALNASGLPEWTDGIGDVVGAVGDVASDSASGCAGPHFELTLGGEDYAFDPLDACEAPMKNVAAIVKVVLSVVLVVAGVRMVARPILSAFGMQGTGV